MKPKHITATSITLLDSRGNEAIVLDAGDDRVGAHISLMSATGKFATISAQPEGCVVISLDRDNISLALTLGPCGLVIRDSAGLLGVTIGDLFQRGEPNITVYREGQPVWSALPSPGQKGGEIVSGTESDEKTP